jgi:DNA-binding transcriptional LysR family regulator
MPDDLSGLRELLLVAHKRSFTGAAAELRVSASAVSQSVRALEERAGVRLLQRTTRSVGLTEAGARFVARLRPALDGVDEAFAALDELRDRPAGVLRLSVPRLGYQQVLAPRLPEFLAKYPEIRLDVDIDDALVDIVKQGHDAGIRIGEMLDREMIGVPLGGPLRAAIVASPEYFAARGKPKHPRDLQAHDCINYRGRTTGVVYRWEFTENGKDFLVAVDGRVLLNDGDLMLEAALAGLGVAYVMDCAVRQLLLEKRLVRVLEPFCQPFPGFFLYYPSRAQMAPKLRAFVELFRSKATPRR